MMLNSANQIAFSAESTNKGPSWKYNRENGLKYRGEKLNLL